MELFLTSAGSIRCEHSKHQQRKKMSIVLTVEEEYNMSPLEARFVGFYNKWNLKTSGDPLESFRGLKNPKGVDLYYEIDSIDDWMTKKHQE